MRAYAYVVPTFWTRGSGKKLRGNPAAQALALYVMTAPSSNMVGLYYTPPTTIAAETGIPLSELPGVFAAISEIAKYDFENEIVWVPEAAAHQVGETMKPTDKRRSQVIRDVEAMGSHPFALEFFAKYSAAYGLDPLKIQTKGEGLTTKQEAPSKGLPADRKPRSPDPDPVLSLPEPTPQNKITIPDQDPISASPEDLTGSARAVDPPSGTVLRARVDPFMRSITPASSDELWIFELWAKTFGKDATFDQGRAACLATRLISGMSRDDAALAIAGAAADDYVMGRKDGKKHDRLIFIFGDQERFEEFRDRGRALQSARPGLASASGGSPRPARWRDTDIEGVNVVPLPPGVPEAI